MNEVKIMGSEQIFVDGKFVGEIIRLDETWTIKIEYGLMKSRDPEMWFYNLQYKQRFRLATQRLKHNPPLLKEVMDSLGKTDKLDANVCRVTVYKGNVLFSETFVA